MSGCAQAQYSHLDTFPASHPQTLWTEVPVAASLEETVTALALAGDVLRTNLLMWGSALHGCRY